MALAYHSVKWLSSRTAFNGLMYGGMMNRNDLVLAALASRPSAELSPVQVQKLFFLIDRNIAAEIGGPAFNFKPYDFGPFDKNVYSALEELSEGGCVRIKNPRSRYRSFIVTEDGAARGKRVLSQLSENARSYIEQVVDWMIPLTFDQLVEAIYKAYPDMKEKSIYQNR